MFFFRLIFLGGPNTERRHMFQWGLLANHQPSKRLSLGEIRVKCLTNHVAHSIPSIVVIGSESHNSQTLPTTHLLVFQKTGEFDTLRTIVAGESATAAAVLATALHMAAKHEAKGRPLTPSSDAVSFCSRF